MINYYELLGLQQNATEDEIRAKLKEKKRIWTQRQNAPKPEQQQEASNNLRMIPQIEATLLDSRQRGTYDQQLKTAPPESQVDADTIRAEDLIQEGWRLLSVGNLPNALMLATQATKIQSDNADAWAFLGHCRAQWGEIDDAIEVYKQAIRLRPNDASFYLDIGGIYEDEEQWADAMKQYQRAAQIDPGKPVYRAAMGSVLVKNEMFKEGIDLLEKCVAEEPDNDGFKYLLALAYTESTYQNWTYIEETKKYLTTKPEHVEEAESYLAKAESLHVSDPDLTSRINDIRKVIENAHKKKFHGNLIALIGAVILGMIVLANGQVGFGFYLIVFGGLYGVSCMTPQYRLNKRVIENGGGTSTNALLSGFEEGFGAGCLTMGLSFIIILLFLPIMTLWNFVKNYLMK